MKIIDVHPYIVGTATQSARRAHRGGVNWVFVKLVTDTGLHGWG
jgi:L-alanine-DL-glutamate epimerase-like enolase superfamily enzyme